MTISDLYRLVGQEALWRKGNMTLTVRIVDVSTHSYGNLRCKVVPVAASGEMWVDVKNLTFAGEKDSTVP